jgi:hypothetical protein
MTPDDSPRLYNIEVFDASLGYTFLDHQADLIISLVSAQASSTYIDDTRLDGFDME